MPTYIQKNINSDITPFDLNKEISVGSGTDTSIVVSGLIKNFPQSIGFITPIDIPGSPSWEAGGTWTFELEVDVGNGKVKGRARCVRLDSAGNILQSGNYTGLEDINESRDLEPQVPVWALDDESTSNRLAIELELITNDQMPQSVSLGVGTTAGEVITNITEFQYKISDVSLLMRGHDVHFNNLSLSITGHMPSSSDIDLHMTVRDSQSSNMTLYLGPGLSLANLNLFMHVPELLDSNIDLLLFGHASQQSDLTLYMISPISEATDLLICGHLPIASFDTEFLPQYVYVADRTEQHIFRIGKDIPSGESPSSRSDFEVMVNNIANKAYDVVASDEHVYWTDRSDGVYRANIDGSNIILLVPDASGLQQSYGVAIDFINNKLYIGSQGNNRLVSTNLDGSNIQILLTGLQSIVGVHYDPTTNKVYYTDNNTSRIGRCDPDGSNAELIIDNLTESSEPIDVQVHAASGHIYWADILEQKIFRVSITMPFGETAGNRTDVETVFDLIPDNAHGLALDAVNNKLYYSNDKGNTDDGIYQVGTNGSNNVEVLASGLSEPLGIYFTPLGGGNPLCSLLISGPIIINTNDNFDVSLLTYGHNGLASDTILFINGIGLSVNNSTLLVRGHTLHSGSISLVMTANNVVSNDTTLYARTHIPNADAIELSINGHEPHQTNSDLLIAGHAIDESGLSLYAHGNDISSSTITLIIGPHEDDTSAFTLLIHGRDVVSLDADIFEHGHDAKASSATTFEYGHETTASSMSLIIGPHIVEEDILTILIHGHDLIESDVNLYERGHDAETSGITTLEHGHDTVSSAEDLFEFGHDKKTSDIILLECGHSKITLDTNMIITGGSQFASGMGLFVFGDSTKDSDMTLFVHGYSLFAPELITLPTIFMHGFLPTVETTISGVLQDATITSNLPNTRRGLEHNLIIGVDASGVNRALIDFDISSIPSGSIISAARIEATGFVNTSGSVEFRTYQVTDSWTESDATWNERSSGVAWSSGGADFNTDIFDPWIVGPASGETKFDILVTNSIQASVNSGLGVARTLLKEHVEASVITTWASVQNPSGGPILIVAYSESQPSMPLYIGDGHEIEASSIYLATRGSGIIPESGQMTLILNGVAEPPSTSCPLLDPTASIQISDELIGIYQSRIDALINQLGKNVLLEFAPIKTDCPNCEYDSIKNRSRGVYTVGGPIPFPKGRRCPYCKGKGRFEEKVTKCIKALLKWNPKEMETFGISIKDSQGVVRVKTYLTEIADLARAQTAIVNYDIADQIKLRVKLIKGPVPVGLREDRYCISFWELT